MSIKSINEAVLKKAVLVELNYKGSYSRFALTPEEFSEEYKERLAEDMPEPSPCPDEAEVYTLRPMVHVWYVATVVGSEQWTEFFTDMSAGLSYGDIANGNLAYIDMQAMKSLAPYLPAASREFWNEESIPLAVEAGIKEADIVFWQYYGYRSSKWPLAFIRMEISDSQVLRLLKQFDEWYGNTNQETTEWALEYQLLARMLLRGTPYMLLNPKFLDLDDESVMGGLEDILGQVNTSVWRHFHKVDWSGVILDALELGDNGGVTSPGLDALMERKAKAQYDAL